MLGIFLVYWIGKKFYDLADRNNRSPWGWAFAGLGIYYGTQLLIGVIIGIIFPEFFAGNNSGEQLMVNLLGVGVGALAWYGALKHFENKWENETYAQEIDASDAIDSIGKDIN